GPSLALFAALMQLDREGGMTERERLRKTIRDLHGVESTHLRSVRVHETFQGQTLGRRRRGVRAEGPPQGGPRLCLEPRDGRRQPPLHRRPGRASDYERPGCKCGSRSRQSTGGDERGGSILALYLLREKSSAEVMTIATQPATPPMSGGQPGPTSHAGSRWIARKR